MPTVRDTAQLPEWPANGGQAFSGPAAAHQVHPRAPMPPSSLPSAAPPGAQHLPTQRPPQVPSPVHAASKAMQCQFIGQPPAQLPGSHTFPRPANHTRQTQIDGRGQLSETQYSMGQRLIQPGHGAALPSHEEVLAVNTDLLLAMIKSSLEYNPTLHGPPVVNPAYMQKGVAHPHHQPMEQMGHGGVVPGGNVVGIPMPSHVSPGAQIGSGSAYRPAGLGAGTHRWQASAAPGKSTIQNWPTGAWQQLPELERSYRGMSLAELQENCRRFGLRGAPGNKEELVARLLQFHSRTRLASLPRAGFAPGSDDNLARARAGFGAGVSVRPPNHGPGTGYPPLAFMAGNRQAPALVGGVGPPQVTPSSSVHCVDWTRHFRLGFFWFGSQWSTG